MRTARSKLRLKLGFVSEWWTVVDTIVVRVSSEVANRLRAPHFNVL
jgi:hypothetical protein